MMLQRDTDGCSVGELISLLLYLAYLDFGALGNVAAMLLSDRAEP